MATRALSSKRPGKVERVGSARLRVISMLAIAMVLAGMVWSRLAYWQVAEHGQLALAAQAQYREFVPLPALRGAIFDRNLTQLVVNTTVYSAFVSPDQITPGERQSVAGALASILGADNASVTAILQSKVKFAYIARRVSKTKADRLRALKLPGVGLQEETQRSYLPGAYAGTTLASDLLGFVNWNGDGQGGLEQKYQKLLAGTPGYVSSYRDLANREIVLGSHTHQDPVSGSDLVLTLDANVQYAAEQVLAAGINTDNAESGSVLIMDPTTGGIVAWADYPSYNANDFNHTDPALLKDNVVSYLYEPGSVMKVVTLSGAINAGVIAPDTVINDPGVLTVGGYRIYDWDRANHGNIDYTYVLAHSLNVGAMKAMQAEGHDAFYKNLQAFGLTQPSGIDVAGESFVAPPSASQMADSQYATTSFGQGIDVNMVQMLSAINVVANGGKYAPPHVVERVGTQVNPVLLQPQRQVVSPQTAAQMTAMMEQVVQKGSGSLARVHGFEKDQTGKTGSSQIPVNGQYTTDVWTSYVGFLPAQHPRFTMLVVVRKPHYPGSDRNWTLNDGYLTAAPIWQKIAQTMVVDWHITPDRS
ncbi:MAG: penicillin-binding protein 2 [Chloroflexi bacterium]|nr:MAG: penicillin-binding protein 2 [Chloroflexota bacterium]TME02547.1 MAG: penicillin-binding protein 2 [Chloroflexota bacterium]TME37818.1 MAG: penicillin-binding protein 2 [Chloroflexota bacterium]TME51968.1 MAG: penicillin-binding protein 2 [Chloroflexota bacterium]